MSDFVFSRNVSSRHNCLHSRKFFCFGCINRKYSCTGISASKSRAVQHSIEIKIIRIFSRSKYFFYNINSCYAISNRPVWISVIWYLTFFQDLCCKTDGIHDLHVSRAATIIITQRITDLIIRRFHIFIKKCFRTHYHSRNAESTLYCSGLSICISIYLTFPFCQPLYGYNFSSAQRIRIRYTCFTCLSINDHCTGSTCALTASVFYRCQPKFITEKS